MTTNIKINFIMKDVLYSHVDSNDEGVLQTRHLYDLLKAKIGDEHIPASTDELMDLVTTSVESLLGFDLVKHTIVSEECDPAFSGGDRERVGRLFRREGINCLMAAYQRLCSFVWHELADISLELKNNFMSLAKILIVTDGYDTFYCEPDKLKPNMTVLHLGTQMTLRMIPTRYKLKLGDGSTYIEVRGYDDDGEPNSFAIKNSCDVLGKDADWHDDRLPSGITQKDKDLLRFSSLEDARHFINDLIVKGRIDLFIEAGFKTIRTAKKELK